MQTNVTESPAGVQTSPPSEVFARRQRGLALNLIDVRTPVEYAEVHAQGARLVPLDRLEAEAVAAARDATADNPLFVICKSGRRARNGAERLHAAGFPNVVCVEGGTDAWIRAGLPVVRGGTVTISLERQVRITAGLLVLAGLALGWTVHPALFGLPAFVGAGLMFAGITDWCGMGMLLAKMPWNNRDRCMVTCCGAGDGRGDGASSQTEANEP